MKGCIRKAGLTTAQSSCGAVNHSRCWGVLGVVHNSYHLLSLFALPESFLRRDLGPLITSGLHALLTGRGFLGL